MQLYFNNLGEIEKHKSFEWWNRRKDFHQRPMSACRGRPVQSLFVHDLDVHDVKCMFYLFKKKAMCAYSLSRHYVLYNRGEPFNL